MDTKWHKWYDHCKKCETVGNSYYANGMCYKCYHTNRWRSNPLVREKQRALSYKWRKENPERWSIISKKATKKWQQKNRQRLNAYSKRRYYEVKYPKKVNK